MSKIDDSKHHLLYHQKKKNFLSILGIYIFLFIIHLRHPKEPLFEVTVTVKMLNEVCFYAEILISHFPDNF